MSESPQQIASNGNPSVPSVYEDLVKAAHGSIQWAVAPSSKFRVGAALLSKEGKIFTGCNIESPVYLGLCAERVALFKALSEGAREFLTLTTASEEGNPCLPCGTCRQLLWEFAPNLQIVVFDEQKALNIYNLEDLLPRPFEREGHGPFRTRKTK